MRGIELAHALGLPVTAHAAFRNLAFGGDDLKTLFVTAVTSVYTLRVKTPGQPHPWYAVR